MGLSNSTSGVNRLTSPIHGFKGFKKQPDGSLKCLEMTYKVGSRHFVDVEPKECVRGMHFCRTLTDVFKHYSWNDSSHVFYHVTGDGRYDEGRSKIAVDTLTVDREVSADDLFVAFVDPWLNHVDKLQSFNNSIVISGSLALIMMGLIKPREIHDLDLTTAAFTDFGGKCMAVAGGGSGNDCVKMLTLPEESGMSLEFDLFVNPKLIYRTCTYKGKEYKVSDPRPILAAKMKYFMAGKIKHAADITQVLESQKGINVSEYRYAKGENIMHTGFNYLTSLNRFEIKALDGYCMLAPQ